MWQNGIIEQALLRIHGSPLLTMLVLLEQASLCTERAAMLITRTAFNQMVERMFTSEVLAAVSIYMEANGLEFVTSRRAIPGTRQLTHWLEPLCMVQKALITLLGL
jgi:hypothetical protein